MVPGQPGCLRGPAHGTEENSRLTGFRETVRRQAKFASRYPSGYTVMALLLVSDLVAFGAGFFHQEEMVHRQTRMVRVEEPSPSVALGTPLGGCNRRHAAGRDVAHERLFG